MQLGFDTVFHHIHTIRLGAIGITGSVLSWVISYLTDRHILLLSIT